jgi:hypothetical protein
MKIALLLTAAVLAVTGLAACGGGDNPKPAPLPTTSDAARGNSPSPPAMPAEAKGKTTTSVVAFIRHWFATFNYSAATGDTAPLRALSDPGCESCLGIAREIDKTYKLGGRTEGDGWIVKSLNVHNPFDISGKILVSPQDAWDSATAEKVHYPGGPRRIHVSLALTSSGWSLFSLELT